ncbi:MAG: response regulator, partial [Acidobacteria bacterium]|nr:response regulator [Acidobacteriota bacterium]
PGQVEQVIVNLIVNARDAMPDGGVVTIETANAVLDRRAVRAYPGAAPGGYVRLRVADTGVGMDDEVRKHVFEPFFTTKPVGKGSGLGLSTVYGIVRQSGGFIHPASEMGKGATFDVFFPMTSGEATVASAARPAVAEGGTETILLVEDDRPIRELSRRVLEKRGYRVLAADGPPAALEAAARETGPIDLLVSDVMMPGGTGPQLYEQLVVERPGLRALFISGYPTELAAESRAAAGAFLQKPFGGEDLSRKVREVLDGAPPAGWHRG